MPRDENQVNHDEPRKSEAALRREPDEVTALPRRRAERIQAAFEPVLREEVARLRRTRRSRALFAFAAVLAMVAAGLFFRGQTATPEVVARFVRSSGAVQLMAPQEARSEPEVRLPGAEIQAGSTVRTGADVRTALELAGGASLRLDADSEIVLESQTLVSLVSGSLYMDSGALGSSPWVRTPWGMVIPIGTQFELRLEEGGISVRVREGAVRVDGGSGPVEARRSEALTVREDGVTRHRIAVHGEEWNWVVEIAPGPERSGSLADYLGWLEREMGWRLRYSVPALEEKARTIELRLPPGEITPGQMLPLLLEASELGYRLAGHVLIIEPKATA